MDIKSTWKEIRKLAAEIDPEAASKDLEELDPSDRTHLRNSRKVCWILSLDNQDKGTVAGKMSPVYPYLAAQYINGRTHRLATPAEIEAEQKLTDAAREAQLREDQARKQAVNLTASIDPATIGSIVAEAVKAAMAAGSQPVRSPQPARG